MTTTNETSHINGTSSINDDDDNEINEVTAEPCWKSCPKKFVNHFTVEPIVLLMYMANALSDTLGNDLILRRTCLITYDYPVENCTGPLFPKIVQSYTTNVLLGKSLIEALFPAVISLFIGPWMDVNGRKPFIIIPLIGLIITNAIWLILSYVASLPPLFFLIAPLPSAIAGGTVAILACSYTYVADKAEENLRAVRMSILALFMGLGILIGNMIAKGYVATFKYDASKEALGIYGTAIALYIVNLLYTTFKLEESVQVDQGSSIKDRLFSFFNFDHIKQSIKVLFVNRPEHRRTLVLLTIPSVVLSIIVEQGLWSSLELFPKALINN